MTTYYVDPNLGNDANDGLGWWKLAYTAGQTAAPAPGATITGAGGATAKILSVVLASGTWAGNDAAGTFYLYGRNATAFAEAENITWAGGSATNNQGTPFDAIVCSFKTLKKTFAAGDIIKVAKSTETAGAGTVTATKGSITVDTTDDLRTPIPVNTIIRIGGDDTLYLVKAVTSTVITLHRPYRGETASGKGITYLTLPTSTTDDWQPTAMVGNLANPITLVGGVSTVNNSQDGFTLIYGNTANYGFNGTWTFVNLSRVGTVYFSYGWSADFTDCIMTNIFSFRANTYMGLLCTWLRVTVNGIVTENGKWHQGINLRDCIINDLETAQHGGTTDYGWMGTGGSAIANVINRWRNISDHVNQYAYSIGVTESGLQFNDAILDEMAVGSKNFIISVASPLAGIFFQNPKIGTGALLTQSSAAFGFYGDGIHLAMVNGIAADNRTIIGTANKYALLESDSTTFKAAAPSARLSMFQEPHPIVLTHYIPCAAGVEKTISVWLAKNASYGALTMPIMRLRWMTGSEGSLLTNEYDVQMIDNTSWQKLSHAVTPSVAGVVIMQLIFMSLASGAIAWYDDIEVS